ncbi:glucoamylase [Panacagrimonas perspica]|uniref:glucan 1,4-alpha-glucosidase n=1 Tax=Panacagrimonas perspica TaxID=381431 RepID=A0A4S3K454_9GAMM|nr:glycoside hydrolase family 15 protein [Panacagrimonas perspica]TDU25772.1 glucoamylase [Panacagrimonas perspica]THD02850.1 glucan 1,4-alpha-glucosidase [Panacagrimonas perspica]
MSETLDAWIDRQYRLSAVLMLRGVSPVHLVKERPGFGQSMRALKGAIVASPVLADWDPDPDYFFHWYRDSAIVVDALRLLHVSGDLGAEAKTHLADFVQFSLELNQLDGRTLVPGTTRRERAAPGFRKFLRDDDELAGIHGDAVVADTRVNPDGTLDISIWTRPQFDGAPLRALALLRWLRMSALDEALRADIARLLRADLEFTRRHWHEPSHDIWEEEFGHHYYTLRVSASALVQGAAWLDAIGDGAAAGACRKQGQLALDRLDDYWLQDDGYFRSRILPSGVRSAKDLDIAVVFAGIHAEPDAGPHSVLDPRLQSSLARLETLFGRLYAINRGRGEGPAMGRYEGDVYHSGGAYFFSTFAAAEFCFRAAAAGANGARAWFQRADAYLATMRDYIPSDGALSEQFDQTTGAQTSAKHLTWSYAACISCIVARRDAARALKAS